MAQQAPCFAKYGGGVISLQLLSFSPKCQLYLVYSCLFAIAAAWLHLLLSAEKNKAEGRSLLLYFQWGFTIR
jgi:hypothetical protein